MRQCASFKLGKDIAHSLATDYRPPAIRARSLAIAGAMEDNVSEVKALSEEATDRAKERN